MKEKNFGADDKYLFARVYPDLGLSKECKKAHGEEIEKLAIDQVKRFGGNFFLKQDRLRGVKRALKLINLGFEKVTRKKEMKDGSDVFDLGEAKKLLANVPLSKFYDLGLKYFESNRKAVLKEIEKCEQKIGSFWFRMVDKKDLDLLRTMSDLDLCEGTQIEYKKTFEMCLLIMVKLSLIPLLPLHESELIAVSRFGALEKGFYPTEQGIIDIILVSLLIACLFRGDDFFSSRQTDQYRSLCALYQEIVNDRMEDEKVQKEVLMRIAVARKIEDERLEKIRLEKNRQAQIRQMIEVLAIDSNEIVAFTKLLIEEPDKFRARVEGIRYRFDMYFIKMDEIVMDSKSKCYATRASQTLPQISSKLIRQAQDFYVESDIDSVTSAETIKFWRDKVLLRDVKNQEDLKGLAKQAETDFDLDILVRSHPTQILNATKNFPFWSVPRKKEFMNKFNPNRLVEKKGAVGKLLYLLKNLSAHDSGWADIRSFYGANEEGLEVARNETPEETTRALMIYKEEECWVEEAMKKIAWPHLPPDYIGALWEAGSDRVRDFIFSCKEDLKVSMPALLDYYISGHKDLRLAEHMIRKLFYQDKIKTKAAWEKILHQAENFPQLVKKIKELREELAQ